MRVGLSREQSVDNSEARRVRRGGSRLLESALRAPIAGATVRASRRRDESGELRHALRLRANRRVPNRCLDRTSLARKLFCPRTKSHPQDNGGIRCELFRRTRWLRAAISVSSCENDREAEIVKSLEWWCYQT